MNLADSLQARLCHYRDEGTEAQRGAVIWPRPHRRSAASRKLVVNLALQSQVGLAFDSEALIVVCEQSSCRHLALRGPLPSSGSVVRSLDD